METKFLIDYSKSAAEHTPHRSNIVMIARWFAVVACASGVVALLEAASRLGWLQ